MPLIRKDADDGERHHDPDVAAVQRDDLFQVELVAEESAWRSSGVSPAAGRRSSTRSKIGRDQQRQRALRRAGHGHQHHRADQVRPVAAGVGEQAQQFLHARTRRRASASSTWPLDRAMPPARAPLPPAVRHGPQIVGIGGAEDHHHRQARTPPPCAPVRNRCPQTARPRRSRDLIFPSGAPCTVR